jgi:hypothetical protein
MPQIRIIAAATVALVFALSLQQAAARSDENAPAPSAPPQAAATQTAAPVQLDNFMKTWKPVASKRVKKSKSKTAAKPSPQQAATDPAPAEAAPAETVANPVVAPTFAFQTAASRPPAETDGVAVTSFDEINQLDAAANDAAVNQVQVVAFNEVNEIDLAAPPALAPAPVETTGQAVSSQDPAPADRSWIGKLLLAAAGTIAIAGATRFLVSA